MIFDYNHSTENKPMNKKSTIELQPSPVTVPASSTNLMTSSSIVNPKIYESLTRRDSIHSSYNSVTTKQIRMGVQHEQKALPPTYSNSQFLTLFPFILFSVLKQLHVVYLILISGFLMVRYCEAEWQVLTVQLCLTLGYICIEIVGRFFTFKFYTKQHYFNDADYFVWSVASKNWQQLQQKNIKVGQIIKIKKKALNNMQQSQQVDNEAKIRVPINLLPMCVPSGSRQISIETFDMDKQEAAINLSLIKNFQQYFLVSKGQIGFVKPRISDQCMVEYTFFNPISESFEATVSFFSDAVEKQISNADTIPRGAYILNQQQIVGTALFNLQDKDIKHLKHIIGRRNSIATLLQKHLIMIVGFNVLITLVFLALNALITQIEIGRTYHQNYHCYAFNYFSLFSFSMNVVMYMILGLHQIIDSFLIRSKCNVHMNNCIKSVDQFGVADTFVMDQFSFVKKNILQVSSIEINYEQEAKMFDQQAILTIVQKSTQLQGKFQNQWLSLTHYYRSKYGRQNTKKKDLFTIKEQKIDMSGSIQIVVSYNDARGRQFLVRFNQKIIFSVLESMTIEKQMEFSEKILLGKDNGELMLMVEVLELKGEEEGIDISAAMYQFQFKFLSLIKLKFLPHSRAVDFLRYLKNKYKIVIMTSGTFEYFQNILVSAAGLKTNNDYIINFEQTQQYEFEKDLIQRIDEYKKNIYKQQHQHRHKDNKIRKGSYLSDDIAAISSQKSISNMRKTMGLPHGSIVAGGWEHENNSRSGNLIIAIHSSLIVYLSRPSIKQLLRQLSKFSTYIICYNCSQFQKQLCSASIFKIFPQHIFLSNFAIDSNIFRISNLSVCISNHSASRYTTAIATSYKSLQQFISKQCVTSIQLTTMIIKTHIFKNQCLIWSIIMADWLIFRAHWTYLDMQYSMFLMYLFNVGFTSLPILYYLVARPELVGDIMVEDYKDYKLRYEHFKGFFSGCITTFVTFAIIPEAQIAFVFVAVLVNCTIMGNFYHLVVDDSASKKWQTLVIILQSLLSIGAYFLTIYVEGTHQLFSITVGLPPNPSHAALFFTTIFLSVPLIILMQLLFMSFHKSILAKDHRLERRQLEKEEIKSSAKKERIIGRVGKTGGKQMRFRRLEARGDSY